MRDVKVYSCPCRYLPVVADLKKFAWVFDGIDFQYHYTLGFNTSFTLENPLLRSGLFFAGAQNILDSRELKYNALELDHISLHKKEDGILTAYEAMNLNLINTDLVVLSACETGLGEIVNGEGVYGLQRAFIVAGAKTLLISLWKVDDRITKELMVLFYSYWLGSGNKRSAFKRAQFEIRENHPQPYYWGAFIMIGA